MPGEKIIDWKLAMSQVGDDREFLDEVLGDLKTEASEAEREIESALESDDYDTVGNAAHRIKGSASYLHCERLREIALKMQNLARSKPSDKEVPELLKTLRSMFVDFREAVDELFKEIDNRK